MQRPWPPILVGGESKAALRRAALARATAGSAWATRFESAADADRRSCASCGEHARRRRRPTGQFQICVGGPVPSHDDVKRWEELGVTRLVIAPWSRSPEAVEGMKRYAELVGLTPR